MLVDAEEGRVRVSLIMHPTGLAAALLSRPDLLLGDPGRHYGKSGAALWEVEGGGGVDPARPNI